MRNTNKSSRPSSKPRPARPPRVPERSCTTDGVYGNNYFMHAATCHVGNLVKIETVQGSLYEGVFKTFSDKFEVVLELAHKVEDSDPQKVNPSEVVDTLIFSAQDIVYMCAPNTEPNYALKGTFQIDANISKFNGEISGEKELQPWEGPPICNGEECDLEASASNQNGWNVHDMFLKNEQFGVQTTYDETLSDYTCQIHRKDTKDFREEEAKAARIAMEIERNPSSQARSALENGDNEEDLYAAVHRGSTTESDEKYVPPPMKRKNSQHHRVGGGGSGGPGIGGSNRANYPTNGGREELNSELKKFSAEFNLSSYDGKGREHEAPKQIQVVTSRTKSPPVTQPLTERNVVTVSLVTTQPQANKFSTATASGQPPSTVSTVQTTAHSQQQQQQQQQMPNAVLAQSSTTGSQPVPALPTALKQHSSVMPPQASSFQSMHLQQRNGDSSSSVLIQHQPHLTAQTSPLLASHPPILHQPKSQLPKSVAHQMSMQHHNPGASTILTPVASQTPNVAQLSSHPHPHPPSPSAPTPPKAVINSQTATAPITAVAQVTQQSQSPQPVTTQSQACLLPPNVHQRPPLQQSQSQPKLSAAPSSQSSLTSVEVASLDAETSTLKSKDEDDGVDDVTSTLKKSTLNPEAKEFVYNPTPKSFTPVSRSPSTPTQSRPHTPQTPSSYNIHAANAPVAATGIQMVMPTYVVAASPGYVPPPQATNRIRKVPVNSHRTPDFHPSNIPVSAVTGQPLLAPSVTLAPSPLGHGTSFPVPAYPHHPQLAAQHYPHVQMIRMVQQGGMVPLVPSTISYHEGAGSNAAAAVYVNHQSGAVTAMTPHTQHVHHQQQHPPPSSAPSPSQTPQGPSQSHTPNSYQHPPLATQSAPPYQSIMCPVIQAPPSHAPPHHMVAAAQAQPHAMQQYLQHQQVAPQPHIQVSLIPHSCS